MSDVFDVKIIETYADENGEEQEFWHKVGTAWPHSNQPGMNVQIVPGVSVAGKLVIVQRKPKSDVSAEPG